MGRIEGDERAGIDLNRVYKPEVLTFSGNEVDQYAWLVFESQIRSKPNSVLTLATGSSPMGMYRLWTETYQKGGLDCSFLTTKNLDEYVGLPKLHAQTYDLFMRQNLFDGINIPEAQRFIPNTEATDPYLEAVRYQGILNAVGPSDLAVLGIGPKLTCHIGFNERGSALDSRTRVVMIDQDTVTANANKFFGGNKDAVPRHAITQGVADILESRKIILIAKGIEKAEGVRRSLEGEIGPDAPASFLRLHPNVSFILDREAASLLSK